ncbi:hypothetical protein VTK73DRAFT_6503 [Phialemonium thermophilum]|uniref:Enoyl reductase (ER) domain-containing protein n=1 Tax=Phialemonium thermophilum TaxID=223376 RepID=A0ABR3WJ28_9PEZI
MAPVPKSMSAVVIEQPGGTEVLKYKTDVPAPELKEGEILVKNEYMGINYIDTYVRTGFYKSTMPVITGREGAGTVVATHPSVGDAFKPGDRVAYLIERGAYAELTAVPTGRALRIPDGFGTDQAAAAMLQGLTAITMISESAGFAQPRLGVSEGPRVLVLAAAGGVGSLLVQMLTVRGAKVIAAAGTAEKCERASKHGAQWTINYSEEDLVQRVKEITNGEGVEVIFDGVGKATFDKDLEMIARKGTLIMFGNASGGVPPLDILRLSGKNVKLLRPTLYNYIATREEFETYTKELFGLLESGKVSLDIHKVYPLKDVAQAHSDLEGRKTTGKLLLKP